MAMDDGASAILKQQQLFLLLRHHRHHLLSCHDLFNIALLQPQPDMHAGSKDQRKMQTPSHERRV